MSFFSWFFGKSRAPRSASTVREAQPAVVAAHNPSGDARRKSETQSKTHDLREQLYEAVRQVMTRSSILSASYKFKVLALDRQASSYLVMIDLSHITDGTAIQPAEMELLIIQQARVRYAITVAAVYWRLNERSVVSSAPSLRAAAMPPAAASAGGKIPAREPMHEDEFAAFQRALLAVPAGHPGAAPPKNVKLSSGPRHAPLPQDFRDTQAGPATAYPGLSSTQYGDLH